MPRDRTPIGTWGVVRVRELPSGRFQARTRFRFEDGSLRQVDRSGDTEPQARRALNVALRALAQSAQRDLRPTTTVRVLLGEFLESKADAAPRTLDAYRRTATTIILPKLGDLSIAEATPRRLDRFLASVTAERGPSSAKMARSVLSGAFGLAVRDDALRANPVREVGPISVPRGGSSAVPASDLPGLLEAIRADAVLRAAGLVDVLEFAAGTGARVGEVCGLDWSSVDLDAGLVRIEANVVRVQGHGLIRQARTKTEAGVRTIPVPASVVRMLDERRSRAGASPAGPVFTGLTGGLLDPNWVGDRLRARRAALGAPGLTVHSFRKAVATALDAAGLTAREVATYLGHADPSLTQRVYMARSNGGARAAVALEGLVARNESAGVVRAQTVRGVTHQARSA